ncbi:uncharacterized protein V1518DRAFT_413627 [Limtongia smithiae]|uniref:uncharacterized protein n=1 Tax=Limtongia smithiae TaxID=1125753 RepID=UPI0034CE71FB
MLLERRSLYLLRRGRRGIAELFCTPDQTTTICLRLSKPLSRRDLSPITPRANNQQRFYSIASLEKLRELPATIDSILSRAAKEELREEDKIIVHGWIRTVRKQKSIAFAQVSDGSCSESLQLVFLDPNAASKLGTGMSIKVTGTLQVAPNRPSNPYEVIVSELEVLGGLPENDAFPLQKKYMTPEYLRRDHPAQRFRTSALATAMRFRSRSVAALSDYFNSHEFVQTHPPLITSSDCEGAGEVFTIVSESSKTPFFGQGAYLTVSTQLHLEAMMMGLARVWTLTPAFRAEESMTSRHLSEFWMLESETAFANDLEDIMSLVESLIRHTVTKLAEEGEMKRIMDLKTLVNRHATQEKVEEGEFEEIITPEQISERWSSLIGSEKPWMRINYADAVKVLQDAEVKNIVKFQHPVKDGESLKSEHEKWLAKHHANGPVFVMRYPASMKPFYMLPSPASESTSSAYATVECFDLLVPEIGELVGGSLREHRLDVLQDAIFKSGLDASALEWYVQLRKWGSVPHGGFGMGFERFLCYLGGVYNIREVIAFPRWINHCAC